MLGVGGLGCCRDRGIVGGEMRVERRTKNQGVARASVPDGGERNLRCCHGTDRARSRTQVVYGYRLSRKLHGRTRAEPVAVG